MKELPKINDPISDVNLTMLIQSYEAIGKGASLHQKGVLAALRNVVALRAYIKQAMEFVVHKRDCIHFLLQENPRFEKDLADNLSMILESRCTCGLDDFNTFLYEQGVRDE